MRTTCAAVIAWTGLAHAEPPVIAVGAHTAALSAGSDHGSSSGGVVEAEVTISPHVAARAEMALDQITMSSDEQPYAFDGYQVVGLAGLRLDVSRRDEYRPLRVYFAFELGEAWMHADHHPGIDEIGSFRIEPLDLGVEVALGAHDLIRVEANATLYSTYESVLGLAAAGLYAHAF